ncbi:hypothetical protein Godav_008343 [Gossypium davidsonii]|uniref:RNase H type-1 domain-containing protein n=1 Tax=Gossypium davidsonii TaxID=34287 RepID=A0A7J8SAI0_GOSDV|nr:hypothetical protein [Gossypium davidsonii]
MASDSMGFSCVELEGDVRSIVQKLSGSGVDRSSIGAIIADGKALFGFFQQCQFKFITRKGNQAAHYLAKHGFTLENDKFRIEERRACAVVCFADHGLFLSCCFFLEFFSASFR